MSNHTITRQQLLAVLDAIADVEGWDAAHPSIREAPDDGWCLTDGYPEPSRRLLVTLRVKGWRVTKGETK